MPRPKKSPGSPDTDERIEFDIPPDTSGSTDAQPFNKTARDAIEKRWQEYQADESLASNDDTLPVETVSTTVSTPATFEPSEMPAQKTETISEEPQAITPETPEAKPLKYKTQEDAERAYREAEKKMHEATQEASRVRRLLDEQQAALSRLIQQQQMQATSTQVASPAPQVNMEELETKFYQNPLGFLTSFVTTAMQHGKNETLKEIEGRLDRVSKERIIKQSGDAAQQYFYETHADIKPLEPLVKEEIANLSNDRNFMMEIHSSEGTLNDKSRKVIDAAATRVRERLPELKKMFGIEEGSVKRERLPASPVVTPTSKSTPTTTAAPDFTPETYMSERRKVQDKIAQGRIR